VQKVRARVFAIRQDAFPKIAKNRIKNAKRRPFFFFHLSTTKLRIDSGLILSELLPVFPIAIATW
jgi:hypothetical protein